MLLRRLLRSLRWLVVLALPALAVAALMAIRGGNGLSGTHLRVAGGLDRSESSREVVLVGETAASLGAVVERVATAGPLAALAAARAGDADFAVAPVGCLESFEGVRVVATLPVQVPLLLVGRDAGRVAHLRDLGGRTITVGPPGSATALIASRVFGRPELAPLGLRFEPTPGFDLEAFLSKGEDGLVAILARADAPGMRELVTSRGYGVASLAEAAALEARTPFTRAGLVPASALDLGRGIPTEDRVVLEFPLGVLAGQDVRPSRVVAMLRILQATFPALVPYNQRRAAEVDVPLDPTAVAYFGNGGPDFVDTHFPRVRDVMPVSLFAQLAIAVSLIANALEAVRRVKQRRLVAEHRRLTKEVARLAKLEAVEVPLRAAEGLPTTPDVLPALDLVIAGFVGLRARALASAESWLSPIEGDPAARAVETLACEWELVLRAARARVQRPTLERGRPGPGEGH